MLWEEEKWNDRSGNIRQMNRIDDVSFSPKKSEIVAENFDGGGGALSPPSPTGGTWACGTESADSRKRFGVSEASRRPQSAAIGHVTAGFDWKKKNWSVADQLGWKWFTREVTRWRHEDVTTGSERKRIQLAAILDDAANQTAARGRPSTSQSQVHPIHLIRLQLI
jgi:hypothetical protein